MLMQDREEHLDSITNPSCRMLKLEIPSWSLWTAFGPKKKQHRYGNINNRKAALQVLMQASGIGDVEDSMLSCVFRLGMECPVLMACEQRETHLLVAGDSGCFDPFLGDKETFNIIQQSRRLVDDLLLHVAQISC